MDKRHMVAGILSASLLAAALPGLALAQDEATGPFPIEGVTWALDSYSTDGTMTDVAEGVEATLFMNGGEAVGSAGCNSYFGSYTLTADSLTFGPLGRTMMLCDGPAQELEDAYLPLLETTAGWALDAGVLSLSDADGNVTLVYSEPPVQITNSDIAALTATLDGLQVQIDATNAEIAALTEAVGSVNIDKMQKDIKANKDAIAEINTTINKLRDRIKANEEAIAALNTTVEKLRQRIKALEENDVVQDARLDALEAAVPVPTPQ
jgi:heat shock protein HslJ/prefoldin subunit 5